MKRLIFLIPALLPVFKVLAQDAPSFPRDTVGTGKHYPADTQQIITQPMDTGRVKKPNIGPDPGKNQNIENLQYPELYRKKKKPDALK